MIIAEPKKVASVIIAHHDGSPGSEQVQEEPMDQAEHGEHLAAEEMLQAIKADSSVDFMKALKSFIEICYDKLEDEEHEEGYSD